MTIAYTIAPGRGDTDLILNAVAGRLVARGYRPCGTVQINTERADAGPCDMDVKVLPDGPVIRISQTLGTGSRGCRLDPNALETAVGAVEARMANGADCLIINKFGKHEAEGRGFRSVIAEAVMQGIPVLVGVNGLNAAAFSDFAGGMAEDLPPDATHLLDWLVQRLPCDQRILHPA
jgi:hypothetical protein